MCIFLNTKKGTVKMKKLTVIFLAICMIATLFSVVACNDDNYDEHEETPDITDGPLDLDTQGGAVTAPPSEADSEDNAYINAAPANDEQGWGALTPRP